MLCAMKRLLLTLALLPALSQASCLEEYRRYQLQTLASPITSTAISSGSSAMGSALSLGGSTLGLISSQTELTTAGALYSVAFAYEGQYYLEGAWWDLRNFQSRQLVQKILKESQVGSGPELQNLLTALNQRTITGDYFTMEDLVLRINLANQDKVLCPADRGVFTVKNLENYLLSSIGQLPSEDQDVPATNGDVDDPADLEDELLDDYWDFFDEEN